MALNFVAAEDGLEEDPKILTLARMLKVDRAHAFWFVMRWRRLVVNTGNVVAGSLPKNYTLADVAAFLDWDGKPTALATAMKATGFLGLKRGRGLHYPGWAHTITGRYAGARESDRLAAQRRRRESKSTVGDPSADVGRRSGDASADGRPTDGRYLTVSKEGASADGPPDPPPSGGALGEERWQWLRENAPTPQNSRVCVKILAELSADEWELVKAAYGRYRAAKAGVGTPIGRNLRCLEWPTDRFLQIGAYERFRQKARPVRSASTPVKVVELDPAQALEARLQQSDGYLMELLADPDVPEEKKQAARDRWVSVPENKGRRPPWKTSTSNGHHRAKGLPS